MMTLAFRLDAATYLASCGTVIALIPAPGLDAIYVLARGLNGHGSGIRSAFGIAMGVLFHTLLAIVGAVTLFRVVPEAVVTLKYVGAAHLGYLGIISFRNDESDPSVETDAGASFRRGVLVNALNPKVALLFLALLPGSVGQGAGAGVRMASLGATYAILTTLYFSVAALGMGRLGSRPTGTRVASALSYVGMGTVLLLRVVLALE